MRNYFKYSFCLRNVLLVRKNISHINSSVKLKIKLSFTGSKCEKKKSVKGNSSNGSKFVEKRVAFY